MATLSNPTAPSFTPTPNPDFILVKTTVTVGLTAQEQQFAAAGLVYKVKCALFEHDADRTDMVFVFNKVRVTSSGLVNFHQQVPKSVLNQEAGPDEIFAQFELQVVGLPGPVNSPIVTIDL